MLLHRPLSLLLVPAEDAVDVCDGSARDIARVPRHLVREPSVRMVGKLDNWVARLVLLNRKLEVLLVALAEELVRELERFRRMAI